jgi:hypothetical protein
MTNSNSIPKFSMEIKAGKSGKREEILFKIEELLTLNIYEFWITFMITAKSEEKARERLKIFEDTVNNLQLCLLSNSSNLKSWEALNIETTKVKDKIFISIIIDPEAPDLTEIIKKLDSLDQSLTSPIDDFISMTFKSELSIKEMLGKSKTDLLQSYGSLEVISEHWSAYKTMKIPQSEFTSSIEKFMKIEGDKDLTPEELSRFYPVSKYLRKFCSPMALLTTQVHILSEALKVFQDDFRPSLSIFTRYMNLGCEFCLEGEDIASLFQYN